MYLDTSPADHRSAIDLRNRRWKSHGVAPSWVNMQTVGLDQFFTTAGVAKACYDEMAAFLDQQPENLSNALYIEPSAGAGAFYDLMPPDRRIEIGRAHI